MFVLARHFANKKIFIFTLSLFAAVFYVRPAFAVLTDSLTIGNAKSLALGNAVTADPPGIDSVHFNPAGLAALKGRQKHLKVVAAGFGVKLKFGDYSDERKAWMAQKQAEGIYPDHYFDDVAHNTTSETAGAAIILPGIGLTNLPVMIGPMGGFSYNPPGSDATFASNIYTPLMAGFYRNEDDPGRFIGQQLSFMALTYFSPSFGYQFNDEFSVGAAMTFNYVAAGIDLPFRSGGDSLAFLKEVQASLCPGSPICGTTINLYDQLGELK
ncbi:MAG TPA: outer membrane protein transport protein, partial [Pseudomonadales bacterium]|nr:outer membrane protein transport protein [Pseudomonadales bacterium]